MKNCLAPALKVDPLFRGLVAHYYLRARIHLKLKPSRTGRFFVLIELDHLMSDNAIAGH